MLRRKIGPLYVVRHLGPGGVWDVYLAVNPKTGERRAMKFFPPATITQQAQPRFLHEIDRARTLFHPRIVKVIESGTLEDSCYYSMQFYAGRDLSARLGRSLPIHGAVRLFAGICDGLAYAHARGVAHGNLKPTKVLIDDSGLPAIAGLGITPIPQGCRGAEQVRRSVAPLRQLAYMPPEYRCGRQSADRRGDVYSLGALLYAMLLGFPPLGQYPSPGDVKPEIPPALQRLIARCLAPDPLARYSDAVGVQADLVRVGEETEGAAAREAAEPGARHWTPVSDRIESWFELLRSGSTRDRLSAVRDMVEEMQPGEANAILKLYPNEEDRVRWGLIRVFGELRIVAASPMIVGELQNPYHRECAVEALGKIGARDAFAPILELLRQHPETALGALLPLASTGGPRAVQYLRPYLAHPRTALRLCAIRALAAIAAPEAREVLRAHLVKEHDERLRSELARFIQGAESAPVRSGDPAPALSSVL